MKTLQWLLAGIAVGVILAAFRDADRHAWLDPFASSPDDRLGEEPFLGYDGMDQETLLDWIKVAEPDTRTALRMARYEEEHRRRQPVLDALQGLLD